MSISGVARRLVVALAFALPSYAQSPAQTLFTRVRQKVVESVARAADLTCTENVTRFNYAPLKPAGCSDAEPPLSSLRLQSNDRLRLDVGVSKSNEMYSWHGETTFNELGLEDLVVYGAMITGTFSSFLAAIFRDAHGTFRFESTYSLNGKRVSEFSFAVSREKSTWEVRDRTGAKAVVGYLGTFLVDPETADLLSLNVKAVNVPSTLVCCGIRIGIEYHLTPLESATFFMPHIVESVMLLPDGAQSRDRIEYSDCRQFVGKSTIRFGASDSLAAASTSGASEEPELPPGLTLRIRLAAAVDFNSNWLGDAVAGSIEAPVYGAKHKLLAPAGARVTGRLIRMERVEAPSPHTEIGFDWRRLESGAVTYRLTAHRADLSVTSRGPGWDSTSLADRMLPTQTFTLEDGRTKLDEDFVSVWITDAARRHGQH
jgi:hypothetical protein